MPNTVTLSSKYQIVIPQAAREALSLPPGDELLVLCKSDRVVIIPKPKKFTKRTRGLHRNGKPAACACSAPKYKAASNPHHIVNLMLLIPNSRQCFAWSPSTTNGTRIDKQPFGGEFGIAKAEIDIPGAR